MPEQDNHPDSKIDVVVVGLNVVDILMRLPEVVRVGEKHEVKELVVQGGAPAGNAACTLARLGWRTGMVVRLGEDAISQLCRADYARYGVLPDLFIADPASSSAISVVQIDPHSGERTVFYSLAGSCRLQASDAPADVIRNARLVLVDGYEVDAALQTLRHAQAAEVASVVDIETGPADALKAMLALSGNAILPLGGAEELTGKQGPEETLRTLASLTAGQVIVTNGDRGSWAWSGDGVHHQPAFRVNALDTTGCGDSYHGAYASALLDGWRLELRMEFAAMVASLVAQEFGGRTGLPTRAMLANAAPPEISPTLRQRLQEMPPT